MALGNITREAILKAVAEYDELGHDQFLSKYGVDRARLYVLVHNGSRYDSTAIVGVAHCSCQEGLTSRPLPPPPDAAAALKEQLGNVC